MPIQLDVIGRSLLPISLPVRLRIVLPDWEEMVVSLHTDFCLPHIFFWDAYSDCTSVCCFPVSAKECFPSRLKMCLDSSSSFHVLSWKIGSVRPSIVTSRTPSILSIRMKSFLSVSTPFHSLVCHFVYPRNCCLRPNVVSLATNQLASWAYFFAQRSYKRQRNLARSVEHIAFHDSNLTHSLSPSLSDKQDTSGHISVSLEARTGLDANRSGEATGRVDTTESCTEKCESPSQPKLKHSHSFCTRLDDVKPRETTVRLSTTGSCSEKLK